MAIYANTTNQLITERLLVGGTNTNGNVILTPTSTVIDVRNDFIWSISPKKNSLQTIPAVYLVERALQTNSLISSALYYINTFLDSAASSPTSAPGDKIITYIIDILNNTFGATALTRSFSDSITQLRSKIASIIPNSEDQALLNTDTLKSYVGIYLTKKTGFNYVLPYFGGNTFQTSTTWGSTEQQSTYIASTMVGQVMGAVDKAAAVGNILQPGSFIEKPKYFQYPTEGESITVTFPLLNTYNPYNNGILPYQQNYELLWILAYQNKPYRTSFSRIIPPKVYTLTVPGVKYMPYCYISNMTVDFQGTRRNLDVTLPTGQLIKAPIPEAYTVTLTFTSLLADIANMMATQDFGFKINTSFR